MKKIFNGYGIKIINIIFLIYITFCLFFKQEKIDKVTMYVIGILFFIELIMALLDLYLKYINVKIEAYKEILKED